MTIDNNTSIIVYVVTTDYELRWEQIGGNHRIIQNGVAGEWAAYSNVAVSPDKKWHAFTAAWRGILPIEQPVQIQTVDCIRSERNTI